MRGKNIRQEVDIENISFDIDTAITLGLIINELVSNSFKHAFKNIRNGTLIVSIHKKDKNFILNVKDNGHGIPEGFSLKKSETLGLQLVDTLIEQFYGKYQIKNNNGTEFIIEIPEPAENNSE
jgi:two-component sensor histidine kinase